MHRATWYMKALRNLGPASLVRLQTHKRFGSGRNDVKLTSRLLQYPVYARCGTSDLKVFDQIFASREYRCLEGLKEQGLIVDCGANVGYSAAYFLSVFPDSFVVAVEPDADNFDMLQRNLRPYKGRYMGIKAAVWPHAEKLRFKQSYIGLGKEWGRAVEPDDSNAGHQIETVDILGLIAHSPYKRASLLKIDIEGAERELFDKPPLPWLDLIDNIIIELHGDLAKERFFNAIKGKQYKISMCDELTVCLAS
jgi:FkbM family methyltransferase